MDKDFLYSDLPKKRIDTFKYLLKNRHKDLFMLVLLMIPFSLPFFGYTIFSRYIAEESVYDPKMAYYYVTLKNFPNFFFVFLFGVGLSGVYYSLRRLLFGDTLRIKYHFFKGIKDSGFEFGLFSLITYIFITILEIVSKSFPNIALIAFICALIGLFSLYILSYELASASLYVNSFAQIFRDAFSNMFTGFSRNIIHFIPYLIPLALLYFDNGNVSLYLNIISISLFLVFDNVFAPLFSITRIYEEFDESINKATYPELYMKGLYKGE